MSSATRAAASRNFHVPLSEDLHDRLRQEAEREGRPSTTLVREAIESWLEARRKTTLDRAVADYAQRWGGSEIDLDEPLVRAAMQHLRARRRKRR
jgi:predicted DNA-binding protein